MTEYQSLGFGPLAPVAEVVLLSSDWETKVANVRLHIDTGSDTTLLPAAAVRELGIVPIPGESFALMAFDGHRSAAPVAEIAIRFCGKIVQGRYVLIDRDVGILGRDVLNFFRLGFDGPALAWGELSEFPTNAP